jgi:beclin
MSFIMLSQSQLSDKPAAAAPAPQPSAEVDPPAPQAPTEETSSRIFDLLSSRTDIDHPVCTDCTSLLLAGLSRRLASSVRERDAHVSFLRDVHASALPSDDDVRSARRQLAAASAQQADALARLEALERDRAAAEAELLALDDEMARLDEEERRFWAERNDMAARVASYKNERDAVAARAAHDEATLRRLQRANVYNDAFSIGHDGFFGTINGLRLGRLPDRPVEWAEINAAWGHTLLLLDTVAVRLGYAFRGYELRPMGSASRIVETAPAGARAGRAAAKPREHELFSSADYSLSLSMFSRKFDGAMVAFLECLRQLMHYAQTTEFVVAGREEAGEGDGGPRRRVTCPDIPYKIEKDRIGEFSIKLGGFSQEEEGWTQACKGVLICCKFLLAHASNVEEFAAANSAGGE